MSVKKVVKKVVAKVKSIVTPKVEEVKTQVISEVCANCDGKSQCSVCSPVFEDTFK